MCINSTFGRKKRNATVILKVNHYFLTNDIIFVKHFKYSELIFRNVLRWGINIDIMFPMESKETL